MANPLSFIANWVKRNRYNPVTKTGWIQPNSVIDNRVTRWMYHHPKTTIGTAAASATAPWTLPATVGLFYPSSYGPTTQQDIRKHLQALKKSPEQIEAALQRFRNKGKPTSSGSFWGWVKQNPGLASLGAIAALSGIGIVAYNYNYNKKKKQEQEQQQTNY